MRNPVRVPADEGVSIWLDDLSRQRLTSGDLARLVGEVGVAGVTTNPSIFRNAMLGSDDYDAELHELARHGLATADAARAVTCSDARAACDVLRSVYEASGGRDGRVSIEVDPAFAHDSHRTETDAALLWSIVDRPNAMIKIPATDAGLDAVASCLARGISVNVTLIFSAEQYRRVQGAFLGGMERARGNGLDLTRIHSVASFFVSRVDSEVDRRLDLLGGTAARALRGHAAIANATLAYEAYERSLHSPRWSSLAAAGAHPQRLLWASIGVKDPSYDDTRYVIDLVAPETVNTVPAGTLSALVDHGVVRGDQVRAGYDRARDVFEGLAGLGIDMAEVSRQLEGEGIAQFQEAWQAVLAAMESGLSRHHVRCGVNAGGDANENRHGRRRPNGCRTGRPARSCGPQLPRL